MPGTLPTIASKMCHINWESWRELVIQFIIKNTNQTRDTEYKLSGDRPSVPVWLKGDYVYNSHGCTGDDIHMATRYSSQKKVDAAVKRLNEKWCLNGTGFAPNGDVRYPDACGKKGYAAYAPTFEAVAVEITITPVV